MIKYQPLDNAEYDSVTSFLAAVKQPCRHASNVPHYDGLVSGTRHSASWYGADCANGLAVIRVMREGWKEGRERLEALRASIETPAIVPIDTRRRLTRGPFGDHLDITQVWNGRLDIAWRSARRQSVIGPCKVEIVANMLCRGGADADTLFWRGVAAVVLCDVLEAAGYMIKLTVCFGGEAYDISKQTSCRIIVKDYDNPFDVATTSAVILPGFFRALGHAWLVNHAIDKRSTPSIGVGCGRTYEGERLISHGVYDRKTAVAWINDTLASINPMEMAA